MRVPKRNERQEYSQKRRAQIEASAFMAEKFPGLKGLKVILEYFNAAGTIKNGEMKCKLNLDRARSTLVFACPGVECLGADFDLSAALAEAVAQRRRVTQGELRCQGTRKRGDHERQPCQTLLRYKLNLIYD